MIIYCRFPRWFRYAGIAVWPFIFIDKMVQEKPEQVRKALINHEQIHLEQQKELFLVGFYLLYVVEFLFNLFAFGDWNEAYRQISFEQEAYINQSEFDYCKTRKPFAWVNYFF